MIGPLAHAIRGAGWMPLVRAYAARRRPFDTARRYDGTDAEGFLEDLFVASGRNLAVAAGFLPAAVRREARVAFLICRVLDAFEDLSPNTHSAWYGIQAVLDYLVHGNAQPPSTSGLVACDEAEAVEISIAAHLPVLRNELRRLNFDSLQRVHALVTDVAAAMQEFLDGENREGRCGAAGYGERVLGRAVRYALQLSGLRSPWAIDYGCIGRVAQAANLLRDAEKDSRLPKLAARRDPNEARLRAVLEALEASPAVPSTLAALDGPALSGARAAVSYMAATTASFYVTRLGLLAPGWLSRPLLLAVLSLLSRRVYLAFCRRLDDLVLDLLLHVGLGFPRAACDAPRSVGEHRGVPRSHLKQVFESWLAMQHPLDARALALQRVSRLAHAVIVTCNVFPPQSILQRKPSRQTTDAVMILDYLLACAMRDVSSFGNHVVREFCELLCRLATRARAGEDHRDHDGDIAAFLAAVVGRANGLSGEALTRWIDAQHEMARDLHRVEERGGFLRRQRIARGLQAVVARPRPPQGGLEASRA